MKTLRFCSVWNVRWIAAAAVLASMAGCPRPEDILEPNNTPDTATRLMPGVPVEGRVIQGNPDIFVITGSGNQTLVFSLESLGEENCNSLRVVGPGDQTLYEDTNQFCGRVGAVSVVQQGGMLELLGEDVRLTIRADAPGDYFLYLYERGEADNILDFSWRYRLTATMQ